jgi:transposase
MMSKVESWEVSDEFWKRVEPLIPPPSRKPAEQYRRRPGAGRPRKDPRVVFEAIVYVLRTGCQWKALPQEFGSGSAIHAYFLKWEAAGFFEKLWQAGLAEYDDLKGIAWRWQSIDGSMMKAPLAQEAVGRNPTDRGKKRQQASPAGGFAWRPVVPHRDGRQPAGRHPA